MLVAGLIGAEACTSGEVPVTPTPLPTSTPFTLPPTPTAITIPATPTPLVLPPQLARPSVADIVETVSSTVVRIAVRTRFGEGVGTGVVMDDQGHILTNRHVVEGALAVQISFTAGPSGRQAGTPVDVYSAKVLRMASDTDIAVLELESDKTTSAVLGD